MKTKTRSFASTSRAFTLVEILIVVAIIGVLLAVAMPAFLKSRTNARKHACIENLGQIESAKQMWGLDKGKREGDVPETSDLIGPTSYIKAMPQCNGGGRYEFNAIGTNATCTIEGHSL
ncbi:MAG: type II secretion system protein [Verrucomicrobiota bacterium]|nr:type II secretion system protein [Verrucomicrobiota bacterium]